MFPSLGSFVGSVGQKLGLPELGVSEFLDGQKSPVPTATGLIASGVRSGNTGNKSNGASGVTPVSTPQNNLSGASASSGGSGSTTASDLAYLDDQEATLRNSLGSTDRTLQNGLTSLNDSLNKETDRATASNNVANAKFGVQREDTTRAKESALNASNAQARSLSDTVRRVLGQAGGTNSSAFNQVAPKLIANDASTKRQSTLDTFGKNFRDIDTAQNDTKTQFDAYLQDLKDQRKQKESDLREGVLTQQQGIQNSLAQVARDRSAAQGGTYSQQRAASAPAQAQAAATQVALDGLFDKFRTPYQTRDLTAKTPTLADYTVDPTTVTQNNTTPSGESPYASFLRKKFADTTA